MADNAPVPEGTPKPPDSTTAPPLKPTVGGKVVVLLSSVAKAPPVKVSPAPLVVPDTGTPKAAPLRPTLQVVAPPPLPAKKVSPDAKLPRPGGNAEVKLPSKVLSSTWRISSGEPEGKKETVPPLAKAEGKKATGRMLIPPIKLNQPVGDSEPIPTPKIVSTPPTVAEIKPDPTKPGDVPAIDFKPASEITPISQPWITLPPIDTTSENSKPLQPPVILAGPGAITEKRPPVLPPPLPALKVAEKTGAPEIKVASKLAGNAPTDSPESASLLKAPALVQKESTTGVTPPPILPAKSLPSPSPVWTVAGPVSQREPAPITAAKLAPPSSTPGQTPPKTEENKPALRPPVLPNKSLVQLKAAEAAIAPSSDLVEAKSEAKPPTLSAVPEIVPSAKAGEVEKRHAPVELPSKSDGKSPVAPSEKAPLPLTRAERAKKRRIWEMVFFYFIMLGVGAGLYFGTIRFCRETRVEGQVIPPQGMPLADEVWIVSDFRQLTAGIAEDLAEERAPLLQEMRERQDHVQRVQADIAMREERIRLLQGQIQAAKDEEVAVVTKARDEAQELWDGPGVQMDDEYNARRISLQNAIASRAKSLNLKYAPDPTYNAPEVWANAYRLALYEVPAGVDSAKEYEWLNTQMSQWRDFVKTIDDKKEQLREKAAQIKLSPAAQLTDLNAKIEDLQHRIETTQSEEDPLKPELQQAQGDLAEVEATESGLDGKYYKQLSTLPSASITKRLLLETNGRFTWSNLENDRPFAEGETEHRFWIFARATRADGREYWALGRFSITKDHTLGLLIEPDSFVSTKAMLRPELSPDEQAQ